MAIKAMLSQEEDQAAESMELFDVLAECEVRKGSLTVMNQQSLQRRYINTFIIALFMA